MATATATKKPAVKTAALNKAEPKAAKTEVAVRKPSAGAVVSIKDALKAQVAGLAERTQPASGNAIQIKKDKLVLPNGQEATELECVIVDFVTTHAYYEGKYDPKNIVPPNCFAIGENPKQMTPSANSPDMQSDSCQGCPMNEFGSSGDGKACKNGRKLAVLPADADADTPIWTISVSPTAIKGFDGYVSGVARMFELPPIGVVTTIGLDPSVDYPKLTFSNPVANEALEVHFARQAEAKDLLRVEPDVSSFQKAVKAPARKAAPRR